MIEGSQKCGFLNDGVTSHLGQEQDKHGEVGNNEEYDQTSACKRQ